MQDKLLKVIADLKAPKGQTNKFGGYSYRSCEDILEAVKPILIKEGLLLTISDDVVEVGGMVFIKAIATISDGDKSISTSALAKHSEGQKGMVDAQLTGSTSSYARKYALSGLLCIDDNKDADATNEHGKGTKKPKKQQEPPAQPANTTVVGEAPQDATDAQMEKLKSIYYSPAMADMDKKAADWLKKAIEDPDNPTADLAQRFIDKYLDVPM